MVLKRYAAPHFSIYGHKNAFSRDSRQWDKGGEETGDGNADTGACREWRGKTILLRRECFQEINIYRRSCHARKFRVLVLETNPLSESIRYLSYDDWAC